MPTDGKKQAIIYVMGLGRSGTTLLDIVLGNGKGFFSCGEINRFPLRRGVRRNTPPGSERQRFWRSLTERLAAEDPRYLHFEHMQLLHRRFEYHLGYMRDLLFGAPRTQDIQHYYAYLNDLYSMLFELSSTRVLVESSKYSGRAWHMSRALPADRYEIGYVYVRRHPVSVVRSFRKKGLEQSPKNWFSANLVYMIVNRLCEKTCEILSARHRVVKITLEDFLEQPLDSLRTMQAELNIDLDQAITRIETGQPLTVGNLFDGNRIRHRDQIMLHSMELPSAESFLDRLTWMLNKSAYQHR
jgi:hypothetical protein